MFLKTVLVPWSVNLRCELASSSSDRAQLSSLSQGGARRRGQREQKGRDISG